MINKLKDSAQKFVWYGCNVVKKDEIKTFKKKITILKEAIL